MVYEGEIIKILTQKEDDWGRYQIQGRYTNEKDDKLLLCVGVIPNAGIGCKVTLAGNEQDTQWGRQFKITEVIKAATDANAGIRSFLGDGYVRGIGPTKAKNITDVFGVKSAEMFFDEQGRKALCSVRGITENVIEKALPSLKENMVYLPIVLFLRGSGTKNQVHAIYDQYGENTVNVLTKNPYRLITDVDGFGFLKADNLALASGIKPNADIRIKGAMAFVLDTASQTEGHCFLPRKELLERLQDIVAPIEKFDNLGEIAVKNAIKDWEKKRNRFVKAYKPTEEELQRLDEVYETRKYTEENLNKLLAEAAAEGSLVIDNGDVYTKKMWETEQSLAKTLLEMLSEGPVRNISPDLINTAIAETEERKTYERQEKENADAKEERRKPIKVTPFETTAEQKSAVIRSLSSRVSVITGGPGRGKTAIAEIIARAFLLAGMQYDKKGVLMLAPTGRAAQRLTESTGYEAMTAHRAVLRAEYDGEFPKGKLIIVDESSMLDVFIALKTVRFAKDCNLIFMGDVNQIASVGPGKVLADLINSGTIPVSRLTKGHRNMGSIAENAALINSGKKLKDYIYDDAFKYKACTSDTIMDTMIFDYKKKIKQYGITEVMLIAAMRERGPAAVNKFNTRLQDILTKGKPEARFGNRLFRVGDRVMQTKNDYNFVLQNPEKEIRREGIFNGEKGTVIKVDYDYETEGAKMAVLFDDGSVGGYTKDTADELVLAYATTIHKCQGSEAKCVMMAYTYADYILLNRALFYTGETRAQKEFLMYGEEKEKYGRMMSAFDMAVSHTSDKKRNTKLAEKLREGSDANPVLNVTSCKQVSLF